MGFEHVPAELKELRQWCCWASLPVAHGKPSKVPLRVLGRGRIPHSLGENGDGYHPHASSTDPATWVTFEEAENESTQLMFALTEDDPYLVVDLDNMPYGSNEVQTILGHFQGAYVEESPSGTGVHIWICAPPERKVQQHPVKDNGKGIDLMSQRHFMTVTGKWLQGRTDKIIECDDGLKWLKDTYDLHRGGKRPGTIGGTAPLDPIGPDDVVIQHNPEAEVPEMRLKELLEKDKRFKQTWDHDRHFKNDTSDSAYDMSLADQLLHYDWTFQEICDAIVHFRRLHNLKPKHPGAIRTTIAKAASNHHYKSPAKKLEDCTETSPKGKVLAVLNHLTGMKIVRYVQVGKTPAQFRLYLEGIDTAVTLGKTEQARKKSTWLSVAQEYYGTIFTADANTWQQFINALAHIREEEEAELNVTQASFIHLLENYREKHTPGPVTYLVLFNRDAFIHDGAIWVSQEALTNWAHQSRTPFEKGEILAMLKAIHATSEHFTRRDGPDKVCTRRYWRIPPRLLSPRLDEPSLDAYREGYAAENGTLGAETQFMPMFT